MSSLLAHSVNITFDQINPREGKTMTNEVCIRPLPTAVKPSLFTCMSSKLDSKFKKDMSQKISSCLMVEDIKPSSKLYAAMLYLCTNICTKQKGT